MKKSEFWEQIELTKRSDPQSHEEREAVYTAATKDPDTLSKVRVEPNELAGFDESFHQLKKTFNW